MTIPAGTHEAHAAASNGYHLYAVMTPSKWKGNIGIRDISDNRLYTHVGRISSTRTLNSAPTALPEKALLPTACAIDTTGRTWTVPLKTGKTDIPLDEAKVEPLTATVDDGTYHTTYECVPSVSYEQSGTAPTDWSTGASTGPIGMWHGQRSIGSFYNPKVFTDEFQGTTEASAWSVDREGVLWSEQNSSTPLPLHDYDFQAADGPKTGLALAIGNTRATSQSTIINQTPTTGAPASDLLTPAAILGVTILGGALVVRRRRV